MDKSTLALIQKQCLRNLFKIRKVSKYIKGHTKPIFNENRILTVHNLYHYFTLTSLSKIRLLKKPEYLYKLLAIDVSNQRMEIPLLSVSHYQNNFLYQGPKLWNFLLPYVKNKDFSLPNSIRLYKSRLKYFLLKMQCNGSNNDWSKSNFCVETYLNMSKKDPYCLDLLEIVAYNSVAQILE